MSRRYQVGANRHVARREALAPRCGARARAARADVCARNLRGLPSPADDFLEEAVDVERLLIRNAPATFLWRVDGSSMTGLGIFDRDVLVVDRSLEPRNGDVVVAIVDGERSLKRLTLGKRPQLDFANGVMPAYELPELVDVEIWGVVTWNLHRLRAVRA